MVLVTGKYQHVRNENIDQFFKAIGVPYIPRKMMAMSHPIMEITSQGDKWTIKNVTLTTTQETTFILGQEYEETMPSGDKLRNVAILEDECLTIVSRTNDENKIIRRYNCSEDGMILTMTHQKNEQVARRFYKRLA